MFGNAITGELVCETGPSKWGAGTSAPRRALPAGSDLVPDPRNARTYPKRQLEQIAASMRVFGFANPILVDGAGGIIAGHGCMLAAKMVGLAKAPSIILSHLIEAQQRALRLADNKIALGAGWDVEILKLELADLAVLDVDFDLSLTGFSAGEIDVVLQGQPDPDAELIPAVPVVADALEDVTRRGDLVLDTFLGSGATLIAAECTCRWFRGLDLDPGYVDVAVSRWSALTGLKPRLARCRGRWMDTVFIERL